MATTLVGSMVASHSRPPRWSARCVTDEHGACTLRIAFAWQTSADMPTDVADCDDHVFAPLPLPVTGLGVNLGGDGTTLIANLNSARMAWNTPPAAGKNAFLLACSNSATDVIAGVGPFKVGP